MICNPLKLKISFLSDIAKKRRGIAVPSLHGKLSSINDQSKKLFQFMEMQLFQVQTGCLISPRIASTAVPENVDFPISFQPVRIELGKRNFQIKSPVSELRSNISVDFDLVISKRHAHQYT